MPISAALPTTRILAIQRTREHIAAMEAGDISGRILISGQSVSLIDQEKHVLRILLGDLANAAEGGHGK